MLACEIEALFPQEWELARQKYNRDLGDLTRLFTGQPLTPPKVPPLKKKSVFLAAPLKTLVETQKIFSETGPFHSCFRPFHSVGKVQGVRYR